MLNIICTGHVGQDPEIRADQSGNHFATFSLAVSVGTKQNPKTEWLQISCGGKLVEVIRNYVKKGSKLLIDGRPTVNAYINKENKAIGSLKVYVNHLEFIGGKSDDSSEVSAPIKSDTLTSDEIDFF